MRLEQRSWTTKEQWRPAQALLSQAQVVLVFGETGLMKQGATLRELRRSYPIACLFGCSTSGEIQGTHVQDDSIVTTAIYLEHASVSSASLKMSAQKDSFSAGKALAGKLDHRNLKHVLVLSVGLQVNGSELVKGLTEGLPAHVSMTGGLAGDKDRFQETLVICGDTCSNDMVAVLGFYGDKIQFGSASLGGWDPFGPERLVTKSTGNVLHELDGQSALELYKRYLGDYVKELPGSALLFPLSLHTEQSPLGVVRTILGIDEKSGTMTFAGDIPTGSQVRFMKANFDRLIDGAIGAAEKSGIPGRTPGLALLISCVGRKLVLKQRIEEEVEGVQGIFGEATVLTGFYSYGEISPFTPNAKCELHNQTMTITTMSESDEKESA